MEQRMRPVPYLGITDFTSASQAERMLKVFNAHKKPYSRRKLHIGVMMSYKTLRGIPSPWASIFPKNKDIAGIFSSNETMNCIHYADYNGNPDLSKSLRLAVHFGGRNINALQLDMIWPDPDEIATAVTKDKSDFKIILQVGKNSFDQCNNNPTQVAARTLTYEGVIDYVLLDKSMGMGKGMDAIGLIPFAYEIWEKLPNIGIATAGGLGPTSMHLIGPLEEAFEEISYDAQGQLRPSKNIRDPIDWNMAEEYIIQALRVLK